MPTDERNKKPNPMPPEDEQRCPKCGNFSHKGRCRKLRFAGGQVIGSAEGGFPPPNPELAQQARDAKAALRDTTTDHARDDAFAEGWHRGRDHQSELGQRRADGAVRVSDSSQPSGERWDKTTDLPVRADSPDSHPEHDDPSRTGREATTNLPAGEGWKSMPIETLLEIGALVKSTIETERARIERIIWEAHVGSPSYISRAQADALLAAIRGGDDADA